MKLIVTDSVNSSDMQKLLRLVDNDTVVIIDIEGVISVPNSAMFAYGANPYRNFIKRLASSENSKYQLAAISW